MGSLQFDISAVFPEIVLFLRVGTASSEALQSESELSLGERFPPFPVANVMYHHQVLSPK